MMTQKFKVRRIVLIIFTKDLKFFLPCLSPNDIEKTETSSSSSSLKLYYINDSGDPYPKALCDQYCHVEIPTLIDMCDFYCYVDIPILIAICD
ncbi:hypothetical protein CHS0354_011687 [Potamilus streckersoni]|uniref:Uncharacterized protein n=1 Tax=Potamilus streckersoni TaxID=2493646 RepID=A0AAE0RRI8_9BIVA|nr:hypothetical protein CHS0354_011687 [Potamilus streckersoni]